MKNETMNGFYGLNAINALTRMVPALALGIALGTGSGVGVAHASQQVGVQAAVHGTVSVIPPTNEKSRPGKSGDGIYFLETVESGADSGMQILLLDETTFTVGPESQIVIDEMVYDPLGDSKLLVSIAKGAFRYISGEIAKQNPKNVTIRTPNGQIGIRGTSFFAVSTPETGGWYFGLLGPGPNNNTGDKAGGIVFSNEYGSAEVRRSGYGFSVEPNAAPSAVAEIPAEVIAAFESQVSGAHAPVTTDDVVHAIGGETMDVAVVSGDVVAATAEVVRTETISQQMQQLLGGQIGDTAQLASTAEAYTPLSYGQVYGYSGAVTYSQNNVPMYYGSFPKNIGELDSDSIKQGLSGLTGEQVGSYNFSAVADFGARTLNGAFDAINVADLGISNGSAPFGLSYNGKGSITAFEENHYATNVGSTAYAADAMITFLEGPTAAAPNLLQGLSIVDASGNDVVIGASIINP